MSSRYKSTFGLFLRVLLASWLFAIIGTIKLIGMVFNPVDIVSKFDLCSVFSSYALSDNFKTINRGVFEGSSS